MQWWPATDNNVWSLDLIVIVLEIHALFLNQQAHSFMAWTSHELPH